MDYSLLKEIEPNLGPFPGYGLRLSSTPSKDYINPGVGQISRIYSLYVPLHLNNSPHVIEKVNDVMTQDGEGGDSEGGDFTNEESTSDNLDSETNEEHVLNEKKRKLMDAGISDSFLHPKRIKIGEILLPKTVKSEKNTKKLSTKPNEIQSKITHKFKIV
jgi:hypothetical protein